MASAIQLTATSTLINGQGLDSSHTLAANIVALQTQTPVTTLVNIISLINAADANIRGNLLTSISNIGVGVTTGQWLLDLYPHGYSVKCSGPAYTYSNGLTSFSHTIQTQANIPFVNQIRGFANVYQTISSHAATTFDTISSINLLTSKTYAQSGLGFTGPEDLATNGIGSNGPLVANVISTWGTMYDIKNIKSIDNIYIFGQNILNQKLGNYGNLATQLKAAGLNINNLLQVPQTTTVVSQTSSTAKKSTTFGQILLPIQANVVTTTVVSGNSSDVVTAIYKTVTGANLQAIVNATGITVANVSITSLNDYLDLNKIVDATTYNSLVNIGIGNLSALGSKLQSWVGQGNFKSWTDLSNFLSNISVPALTTSSSATDPVLSPSVASTLCPVTGSGPFNNFVISDYLGAASGVPYSANLVTINSEYSSLSSSISLTSKLNNLQTAVTSYIAAFNPLADPLVFPPLTSVNANVTIINNALNSLSPTTLSNVAYNYILTKIGREVDALTEAGVVFNNLGTQQTLNSFAQRFGTMAADSTQTYAYQFFSNIITADSYGDTIRSAIAEAFNIKLLQSKGISFTTDPSPAQMIQQAQAQNIPLSTYISRNK